MAHESRDDEDNTSQIDQTREECPEWIDDTDEHSYSPPTVPPQNARKRKSHAVIKRRATTSESSDDDEQSYVISKIFTQKVHGLRRRARDDDGNPRLNSPLDYTRYEHLITTMKLKGIDVYFVQETWLKGEVFDKIINGYHVFRHNGGFGNHNFRGVAIILSSCYHKGWKAAGARPPTTTDATGEFAGRFISLNIKLESNDRAGKTIQGKQGHKQLALTLVLVYHPCTKTGEEEFYLQFLETLDNLLGRTPAKSEIVMGADVNSNIGKCDGIQSMEFCAALGPHGLPKRNTKGENLLHIYLAHRL